MNLQTVLVKFEATSAVIEKTISYLKLMENAVPVPSAHKVKIDLTIQAIQSALEMEPSIKGVLSSDEIVKIVTDFATVFMAAMRALGLFKSA